MFRPLAVFWGFTALMTSLACAQSNYATLRAGR